jgi:HK97 gp10 family phage protein
MVSMKVQGLKELEASLIALNKEYGGKSAPQAMRPAIKAAMAPLQSELASNTPVDTGALRDSASVKIGKPSKKMVSNSAHYNSTTIIAGRVGWFWRTDSLWYEALAVEFGTQNKAGQHPLKNLFDSNNQEMLNTFKRTLGPAIEKKAKQLHKKKMKGK